MTTIYDELFALTADQETPIAAPDAAFQAIKTAALPDLPEQFRREMRDKTARFIIPEKPDGMEYFPDCFWREFQQKQVWHRAWLGTAQQKAYAAEWLKAQRETALRRGNQWPPRPMPFRPKPNIPQVWDGKEEKERAAVPRDGK